MGTILGQILLASRPNFGLPGLYFHGNSRVNNKNEVDLESVWLCSEIAFLVFQLLLTVNFTKLQLVEVEASFWLYG
jgi:hypothetical protein